MKLVDSVILHVDLPLWAHINLKSSPRGSWKLLADKGEPSGTPLVREIRDELVADARVPDCAEVMAHEYRFGAPTLPTSCLDVAQTKYDSTVWLIPSDLAMVPTVQALPGLLAIPSDPTSHLTLVGKKGP